MNYIEQITKTVDTSLEDYNVINLNYDYEYINVYINGILQDNKCFQIVNNQVVFDKTILKDLDYINIDYVNNKDTQLINNKIRRITYYYNGNNEFEINMKLENNNFVNVYINGILQDDNYEYINNINLLNKIKINSQLKENDIIIFEIIET